MNQFIILHEERLCLIRSRGVYRVIISANYWVSIDGVKREYNYNYNSVILAAAHDKFRDIKLENNIKSILDKSDGRL
jgi:hypothetical protein